MSKIIANTIENVAGTETHDVATMGIESGVDSGGNYVKFPDGTLIYYGGDTALAASFSSVSNQFGATAGSMWYSGQTITTGIPFVGTYAPSSNSNAQASNAAVINQNSFIAKIYRTSNLDTPYTYTAIGRWK